MMDQLVEIMERFEGYLVTLVRLQMAPILEKELQDDFIKKLWDMTGTATRRQIDEKLKCGPNKISDTWQRWSQLGLLIKEGKNYRKVL